MRELSIKRGQMGRFGSLLRRKFARYAVSSSSTTGRVPKVLTAFRLVQWGLRVVLLAGMLILIEIYAPRFFRYQNVVNILLQVSLLGLMTIGMTVADWWGVTGRRPNVRLMNTVDAAGFYDLLMEKVARLP